MTAAPAAIRSVPQLLAAASGLACEGDRPCFYCGAPCDGSRPAAEFVKDSFTGRSGVRAPGSDSVCEGCVLALREDAEVDQIDGARRRVTKGCMRAFSWVVTRDRALAASKAHLGRLRSTCLDPPAPPFAVVLSDSGQTHQLYRGVVNRGGPPWVVTLEGEAISYSPGELRRLLDLCGRVVAASGKPALKGPATARLASAVIGRYPRSGEGLISEWSSVRESPSGRLAAWLCPGKDEAQREHPSEADAAA